MIKFLVSLVVVTTVSCEHLGEVGLTFDYNKEYAPEYHNYQPRDYHFDYHVSDPHTGDHKSQWEVKQDGVVRGGYSLLEPDGTTRIVEYIADHEGFRAVVKKLGHGIHPDRVETHGLPVVGPEMSHYGSYDGGAENYVNVLEPVEELHQPNIEIHRGPVIEGEPLLIQPEAIGHVEEVKSEPVAVVTPEPVTIVTPEPRPVLSEFPIKTINDYAIDVRQLERLKIPEHVPVSLVPVNPSFQTEIVYAGNGVITEPRTVLEHKISLPAVPPAQPPLVTLGPSYNTIIEYHGLTGNPEDDSRYSHQGDYSEKVEKVVVAPKEHAKTQNSAKNQFIIYYPDKTESNYGV